jgi:SAM-dependent methyltransferase
MARVTDELINGTFAGWEHPYARYEREVSSRVGCGQTLLDVGCGRTAPVLRKFANRGIELIGIDCIDFTADQTDMQLYRRDICDTGLSAASVDLAMARSVMEHVTQPIPAYTEMARVLKAGGRFVFLTANAWDYVSFFARLVPNRLHGNMISYLEGRLEEDVFPTAYKTNTKSRIYRHARLAGLEVEHFEYLGQYPSCFLFDERLFKIASAYEKFLARNRSLHFLRGWILAILRKPHGPTP